MTEQKQNTSDDLAYGIMIILLAIVAIAFFAPALVFALAIVLVARKLPWYITAAGLLVCVVAGLAVAHITGGGGMKSYLHVLANGFMAVLKTGSWTGFPWGAYVGSAFLLGPLLGCIGLAVLPSVKLPGARAGALKQTRRAKGFMEKLMLLRLTRAKHPKCGTHLGISQQSMKNITLNDKELNQHCLLVGTTGAGKTVTLSNFAESAIQRGIPLVYVDGKGEVKLVSQLQRLAEQYGRKFYLFSVNNHPAGCRWNPLARGKPPS